jgi:hypothetical protein
VTALAVTASRAWATWLLGTALVAVSGCQQTPPLANTQESARAVAEQVLDALARRDRAALERLAISEPEFRAHVWPSLPAARRERNLPMSYVWGDLHQKSVASLARILATHGGRRYELIDVGFAAAPTAHPDYVVHRESMLAVRDAGGQTAEIRVCGSFIEKGGRWKVFSYVVDE